MEDWFTPPSDPPHRTRTPLCRAAGPGGDRCVLYREHFGNHKGNHLATEWADDWEEQQ